MMFFEGNIAAPPTITVFSSALAGADMVAEKARRLKAAADRSAIRFDMDILPIDEVTDGCRPDRVTTAAEASKSPTAPSLAELREGFAVVSAHNLS
jgi:hypothetical protein